MQSPSTDITLGKIVATIGDLPASPAIVSAVMGLTSDLDTKVVDISDVLSSDQSLTAKVLKLSNSSFYGRSKEVSTLQEAILILGFFTVRSIVIATSAHSMYRKGERGNAQEKLWQHSLATAVASRQIVKHTGHSEKEQIFIAALLHDIGKLVLMQKLPERYSEVISEVERNHVSFLNTERQMLGFTHCDVAAILLDKWSFPATLISAIQEHHEPSLIMDSQTQSIANVVNLGNYMAKKLDVGFNDRTVDDLSELESARLLELGEQKLQAILEEVEKYYQVETRIFEEA